MDTRKAVKTYHRNLAIVLAIIVAIFAAIPLVVDKPYIINIFVLTFYMSTLSMAWNILGGITGQNSLGLAAYMGLGAYVCCLVVTKTGMNPWVAAVLDMLVVGVVAGVIFFPSLILRGPYFTLVSIAFAESIRQFIINSEFFGRASGVGLPFGKDSFAQFRFTSKVPYYYIGFIMMVGVYLIMKKIGRSKLGFALRTIREDEDAAAAIGITGQNSLGLAAYMGLGAYVCCLVVTKTGMNPWVAAVLDMLVVGVVAGVIFFPSLILRGPYFTLVSIAFAESIRQFIINSEFFGRASGVGLPFGKDSFAQFRFTSKVPYYYIGFIMMVGVYLIMKKIGRSKLGFALRTIREDEDAAAAIGINPTKYKVIAVVISAIIAGLVGFFYVSYIRYIDPDIMIQSKSTEIVLPAVVGGAAYIEGPLIGGLIMIPLSELLRANFAAILPGINMLMYAIVLIVVIRFRPSGILGWYMNSKVKTFIDEKILKKPSLDVLEEYELMADKGGK